MKVYRQRQLRSFFASVLALLLVAATPAVAEDTDLGRDRPNVGEFIFDIMILRPLGIQATLGGFGVFLITAPWLAPSREIPYGWDTFVMGPVDYTFKRPLGEF